MRKRTSCCSPAPPVAAACRVESLVTVDDRGQMVLPKELRDRMGIRGGDKLALVAWEKDGKACCLSLMRVDDISGAVKRILGPLMGDVLGKP